MFYNCSTHVMNILCNNIYPTYLWSKKMMRLLSTVMSLLSFTIRSYLSWRKSSSTWNTLNAWVTEEFSSTLVFTFLHPPKTTINLGLNLNEKNKDQGLSTRVIITLNVLKLGKVGFHSHYVVRIASGHRGNGRLTRKIGLKDTYVLKYVCS